MKEIEEKRLPERNNGAKRNTNKVHEISKAIEQSLQSISDRPTYQILTKKKQTKKNKQKTNVFQKGRKWFGTAKPMKSRDRWRHRLADPRLWLVHGSRLGFSIEWKETFQLMMVAFDDSYWVVLGFTGFFFFELSTGDVIGWRILGLDWSTDLGSSN